MVCVFPASLPGWLHVTGERCWWNRARLSRRALEPPGAAAAGAGPAGRWRGRSGVVSERVSEQSGSPLPPPPSRLGFPAAVSPSPTAVLASRLARCSEKWKPNRQENPARKERKIKRLPKKKWFWFLFFFSFFCFFCFLFHLRLFAFTVFVICLLLVVFVCF